MSQTTRAPISNRFNRWSRQGVWFAMFEALTGSTGITATVSIDSIHIKAHRSAAGARGGLRPGHRQLAGRAHHQDPCRRGRPRPVAPDPADARQCLRHGAAPLLLQALPPIIRVVADRGYGSNALCALIAQLGAEAVTHSLQTASGRSPTIARHMVVAISSSPATSSRSPSSPLQSLTDAIESGA